MVILQSMRHAATVAAANVFFETMHKTMKEYSCKKPCLTAPTKLSKQWGNSDMLTLSLTVVVLRSADWSGTMNFWPASRHEGGEQVRNSRGLIRAELKTAWGVS